MNPNGNATSEDAIRSRLIQLTDHFSQSEIARRTGASRTNVSRYLRGNRIPATFLADCARSFGVNPQWLLFGEGGSFVADAAKGVEPLTSELLDVVQALNVVGQMRIGSMGGQHHLKMLRELGNALTRHETLRERLNRHSVPILREVLRDLRAALAATKIDLARDLSRTAEQLERFCDASELAFEHAVLRSRLELMLGNIAQALALTRKAIVLTFHSGELLGAGEFEGVVESVSALHDWGRFDESLRLAKAAFSLASPEALRTEGAAWLSALVADIHIHTGNLREGVEILMKARGDLVETHRVLRADAMLGQAMLCSRAVGIEGAIAIGGEFPEKAGRIMGFGMFMEEETFLHKAIRYWEDMRTLPRDAWLPRSARLITKLLRGERKGLAAEIRAFLLSRPGNPVFPVTWAPILGAQLYRLLGRARDARKCFSDSKRLFAEMPDWFQPGVMWKARHQRNALELGTKQEQKAAREFFRRQVGVGYLCFSHLT